MKNSDRMISDVILEQGFSYKTRPNKETKEECKKCKDFIDGLQTVIEGQQIIIKSLINK